MAALPRAHSDTAQAVYAWREQTTDVGHRPHLGASVIGHPCDRHLWLLFRWAETERFEGRVLRLFDTGRREEPRVHEELRGIGCEVHADDGGAQFRVSSPGGHFGGSMDGVIRGLPEAPKAWHVLEVKTHSGKSFGELEKKGVRAAKPMHWAQMQTYMHLAGIERALYYAVNKDTDAIYTERVEHDKAEAEKLIARADRIISASEPPLRISDDPAWFECKWCRFRDQCHGTAAPEVNCRTCAHSTPVIESEGGEWRCSLRRQSIGDETQRTGCELHRYIPVLLQRIGEPVDSDGDSVTYQTPAGARFVNGPAPGFASAEIRAAQDKGSLTDPLIQKLKAELPTARLKR